VGQGSGALAPAMHVATLIFQLAGSSRWVQVRGLDLAILLCLGPSTPKRHFVAGGQHAVKILLPALYASMLQA